MTDLDGLKTVTTVEEIAGDWWVVRGLNPHYDSYACQHNRYERLPDGTWINNVTWMNTYKTPPVEVRALPIVTVSYPGVFLHNYTSLRQLENWVVVSRPTKDYMFMLWCVPPPLRTSKPPKKNLVPQATDFGRMLSKTGGY